MPTIEENREAWDANYEWPQGGDEWSKAWGGVQMQWHGVIMPRLHAFLPAKTILEIAPGFGRMTHFLTDLCEDLVLVDISESCIDACRKRFAGCSHISYHVNDGASLAMIEDDSIDFALSFDSLVHVECGALSAYLEQLQRKLKADGAVFIHHSNLGEYKCQVFLQKIPLVRSALRALGLIEKSLHWRSPDMTARRMEALASEHGLRCVSQEIITWGTDNALIDCLSLMVKQNAPRSRENRVFRNSSFMDEAKQLSKLSSLYRFPGD